MALAAPLREHLFSLSDCLSWIQTFWASLRAIHDGMTAIQFERVIEIIQTCILRFVTTIYQPSIGGEQGGRPQVLVAIPPITGAAGRTASAQNTGRRFVNLFLIIFALQTLMLFRRGRARLQPRFD